MEENDEKTWFINIRSYSVFTPLFDLLKPFVISLSLNPQASAKEGNTAKNQFCATLIKLHHNIV